MQWISNVPPLTLLCSRETHHKPTTRKRWKNALGYPESRMVKTQGPTLLRTRKNALIIQKTRWRKPKDQHCYAPEKMPSLSKKHDEEKPRTNTATHQKKCPRYPENMMEKTQGPTLLRTRKNALVIQKTRWRKPKDQHCYDLKKHPRYPENRMEKT